MPQPLQQWIWSSGLLLLGFGVLGISLQALHQERLFPQTARADEGGFVIEPAPFLVRVTDPHMPGSAPYTVLRAVDRGRLEFSDEKPTLQLALAHERMEAAQYAMARGESLVAWSTMHKGFGYLNAALECTGDECPDRALIDDTCDDMKHALEIFVTNVYDDALRSRAGALEQQRAEVCE